MKAFHGTVIHSLKLGELEILEDTLLLVADNGRIELVEPRVARGEVPALLQARGMAPGNQHGDESNVHYLARTQFLVPGFGLHILDWLDRITFPHEARFADPTHARRVYGRCVAGFLQQGVTTASYYGSRHAEATDVLADVCFEQGQRALVGKCNMDRNAPDTYRDTDAEESLRDTEACIAHVRSVDPEGRLLQYVLTPRFAITCTPELLRGLGDIAARSKKTTNGNGHDHPEGMAIQTHFNEAEQEMASTRGLFPEFRDEVELYSHFGLLTPRTILAHCCYATDSELDRLMQLGCGVTHCPVSNMTVGGGFMAAPVRAFLDRGIPVGLGTDSGGGFSSSMLDAMRQAIVASNAREVQSKGQLKGLTIPEVFHLATLGGARVCGLTDKVGTLEVGKEFDALLINADPVRPGVMTMVEDEDSLATVFEKFVMTGDDRNIEQVFVCGQLVKSQA
ncbi:Guanine deaminase [Apiospora rasikravindrae]|uniref:Guanine deaminase n=1 Tax=Apiospora rasikravindrae TaxID=990691 RepID=A0ABR1S0W3_9PEZI